jgi:hypothetical protein
LAADTGPEVGIDLAEAHTQLGLNIVLVEDIDLAAGLEEDIGRGQGIDSEEDNLVEDIVLVDFEDTRQVERHREVDTTYSRLPLLQTRLFKLIIVEVWARWRRYQGIVGCSKD